MASAKVGAKLPVALQLPDSAPNKFVLAYTYNPQGALIYGPTVLSHVASGLYLTNSLTMPDQDFVAIQYKVFSDDEYSVISPDHGDCADLITKETPTEIDLSPLATAAQLLNVKQELLETLAHKQQQVKVAVSGLNPSNELEFQTWLNLDGYPVEQPSSATLSVMNPNGVVIFTLSSSTPPTAHGVFKMVKSAATDSVVSGQSYTVYATVTKAQTTYASITSISVF